MFNKDVRPALLQAKPLQANPRSHEIHQYFESLLSDTDAFVQDYKDLMAPVLPNSVAREPIDLVISHNDFQENNVMIWHEDKTKFTLIDFEYSNINFRGYDIASYFNECFIDYSYPKAPSFKIYEEQMIQFIQEGITKGKSSEMEKGLTAYLTEYHRLKCEDPLYSYSRDNTEAMLETELPILKT